MMTGSGGWPLNIFLTPEGKPLMGGTYFPPADAFGRPGFPTVLRSLAEAWETKREDIEEQGEKDGGEDRDGERVDLDGPVVPRDEAHDGILPRPRQGRQQHQRQPEPEPEHEEGCDGLERARDADRDRQGRHQQRPGPLFF